MVKVRGALRPAAVVLSYLIFACLVYWPVSPVSNNRIVDCVCNDPIQEVWFLHWTSWAAIHGHNPFFTYFIQIPNGANLALNTSFPLLGILAAPITWLGGPLVTYNVLLRLALGLSAASMYWVLRRYTQWWPAAYFGGLLYGFSPYMTGHAHRHLFLTFVPLVPLLIPVVDNWLVRMRRSPVVSGVLVGLLTAGQFLISPEVALLAVFVVVLGLIVLAVRFRSEVRARLRPLLIGTATAAATLLVIAGYPVYLLLAGPQRPIGALHGLTDLYRYHGDLVAPIEPTHGELLSTATSGAKLVNTSITENGFYLGIPLVIFLVFVAVRLRRHPLVLSSVVVALVAFIFSLGETLTVATHKVLDWMPFTIVGKLPVLQNIEPARLSLFVQLPAAIMLGLGLDFLYRSRRDRVAVAQPARAETAAVRVGAGSTADLPDAGVPDGEVPDGEAAGTQPPPDDQPAAVTRKRTALVTALAVVMLVPLIPRADMTTYPVHVPEFFTSDAVNVVPQDSIAMTYPFSRSPVDIPMLWQSASNMRFRMFGGMAFVPGPFEHKSTWTPPPPSPPDISALLQAPRRKTPPNQIKGLVGDVATWLGKYHVDEIFVDPTYPRAEEVTQVITEALGNTAPQRIKDMDVWLNIQKLLRTTRPNPGR